jgi:hypothetical protein
LHLCVCLFWFKETGGLHTVRRSRVHTSCKRKIESKARHANAL